VTVNVAQFRADFTEFTNATTFPDSGIQFWLTTAYLMLPACRWSTLLDLGAELFAAHNVVLEALATRSVATGALPGLQLGVVSGKSVDRVSLSYDAQAGLEIDAGHWNLTTYGTRFIRFARMAGMGAIQVNDDAGLGGGYGQYGW